MADRAMRIDELSEGRRGIERSVLMYKVDPSRYEVARTLARLIHEGRHRGAAVAWSDKEGGPIFPHVKVGAVELVERLLLGYDADSRAWTLGLSSPRTLALRDWDLGWIFADVAYFVPREAVGLEHGAPPVEWVIAVAGECTAYGWNARRDVLVVAAAELERQVALLEAEEAGHLAAFATGLRARDIAAVGRALLEYGTYLQDVGRLDAAADVLRASYEAALHLVDSRLGAQAARLAGRALRRLGRWDEAFRWYELATDLAKFDDDLVTVAHALNGIATAHVDRGATPKAREYSAQAIGVARASGDRAVLGAVYRAGAMIQRVSGNLTEGAFLAWQSVVVTDDPEFRAHSLVQLGSILVDSGQLELATHAYRLGLAGVTVASSVWISTVDALSYIAALRLDAAEYHRLHGIVAPLLDSTEPRDRVQLLFYRAKALAILGSAELAEEAHHATIAYADANGFLQFSERSEIELEAIPDPPVVDQRTERIGEWLSEAVAQLPGSGL